MKRKQRILLDKKISVQRFPHFFNRTIRTLKETHLKATEIRNFLFFFILPMVRNLIHYDTVAHLGLFVTGIRLLHGPRVFGDKTADVAHDLLTTFYHDHERQYEELKPSIVEPAGVFDETTIPVELVQMISSVHASICQCQVLNQCIKFYRRFRHKNQIIFHSLAYTKRQSSVSYFVKYNSLFGSIITFMSCNDKQYAIIKRYPIKKLFSDYFVSSPYYGRLMKPLDTFFFVLEKVSFQFDLVDVYSSLYMCVVIEEDDCLIVSPISVYHEHD
ncbi:unnamed protein product [Rotaria sordida]|uniref:Uncharacterized protein n=1 Tax=Rotaria sordida TaxID=392033 RepID=A0A815CL72_9BILA|nr:unnamed protein product [Rotaria sordida]